MRLLFVAVVLLTAAAAGAQSLPSWAAPSDPVDPADGLSPSALLAPPTSSPPTPAIVPLDGGLGLLALAGGAYAAARLRRRDD